MKFKVSSRVDLNDYTFDQEKYKVVYVMVGEDPYNALKGDIPVKIGISNKVDSRKVQIKNSLKEKTVTIDGIKQTISITNPEIFCISVAFPYAEAVEKAAQKALCKQYDEKYNQSAKISGYNDWFKVKDLLDAVTSVLQGIQEVEGDIAMETKHGNYHILVSETYNRKHEFYDNMEHTSSMMGVLFSGMSSPSGVSLSDGQILKRTKKKYLIRDTVEEDFELWNVDRSRDWKTLVVSIKNYANKKIRGRVRIPVLTEDLLKAKWNLNKLRSMEILSMLVMAMHKEYIVGVRGVDPNKRAFLGTLDRRTVPGVNGRFQLKNSIDQSPGEWWQLVQAN